MGMHDVVEKLLVECAQKMGLRARRTKDRYVQVELDGRWWHLEAHVAEVQETDAGGLALITFGLQDGLFMLREVIMATDADGVGALISAVTQFLYGFVAPIAALYGQQGHVNCDCDRTATVTSVNVDGMEWQVSYGQVFSNDDTGDLYAVVDKQPPLMHVWESVAQRLVHVRPHTVKVYLCRFPDGAVDGEVRIDNQVDDQAFEVLKRFDWPTDQPLIWFRQFGILMPPQSNFAPEGAKPSHGLINKSLSWLQKRALH